MSSELQRLRTSAINSICDDSFGAETREELVQIRIELFQQVGCVLECIVNEIKDKEHKEVVYSAEVLEKRLAHFMRRDQNGIRRIKFETTQDVFALKRLKDLIVSSNGLRRDNGDTEQTRFFILNAAWACYYVASNLIERIPSFMDLLELDRVVIDRIPKDSPISKVPVIQVLRVFNTISCLFMASGIETSSYKGEIREIELPTEHYDNLNKLIKFVNVVFVSNGPELIRSSKERIELFPVRVIAAYFICLKLLSVLGMPTYVEKKQVEMTYTFAIRLFIENQAIIGNESFPFFKALEFLSRNGFSANRNPSIEQLVSLVATNESSDNDLFWCLRYQKDTEELKEEE